MIDVSDGLLVDLERLLEASGVGCDVDPTALPVDADLRDVPPVLPAFGIVRAALSGGEDFELLFTVPEDRVGATVEAAAPVSVKRIGTVTTGPRMIWDRTIGEMRKEIGWWDHLRTR